MVNSTGDRNLKVPYSEDAQSAEHALAEMLIVKVFGGKFVPGKGDPKSRLAKDYEPSHYLLPDGVSRMTIGDGLHLVRNDSRVATFRIINQLAAHNWFVLMKQVEDGTQFEPKNSPPQPHWQVEFHHRYMPEDRFSSFDRDLHNAVLNAALDVAIYRPLNFNRVLGYGPT